MKPQSPTPDTLATVLTTLLTQYAPRMRRQRPAPAVTPRIVASSNCEPA